MSRKPCDDCEANDGVLRAIDVVIDMLKTTRPVYERAGLRTVRHDLALDLLATHRTAAEGTPLPCGHRRQAS